MLRSHIRWQPVMKHVTLIVDSPPPAGQFEGSSTDAPPRRPPQNVEANACLSIEVRLSPARAQLLVDLLLELEREEQSGAGTDELIATLLRNQLKGSDHLAGELFDKVISHVEKVVIRHAYENCNRVQTRTAEHLGIDRNTLHKKLRRYNLLKEDVGATEK
ncbi:MAG TPA: hypothetical protein DDY91_08430 [Planctomycetaceae bacterium]|nr:hypothetical protein [Planctomycetaceae bacterium]